MFDFLKWRSVKRDSAPGTLVYAGEKQEFTPSLCALSYDENSFSDLCPVPDLAQRPEVPKKKTTLLRQVGIHEPETMKRLGEWFSISALVLEDVMNTGQRPKLEWQDDDTAFIVIKDVSLSDETGRLDLEQICLLWRQDLVILFQEEETPRFDGVLERIRKGRKIRSAGPDYLVVALLDAVIDNYYSTLEKISIRAENLERALERSQSQAKLLELYQLRRESIQLRNILQPVREILSELIRNEDEDFSQQALPYLWDVGDHAKQVVDAATGLAEIMQGMIELQISLSSMQANRIMQVLTLVATIFIPLTFITGIYGMNFEYMPELRWHYGYYVTLGIMGGVAVLMSAIFVWKRWL